MSKKVVGPAICALLLALCSSAEAQQPKTVFRVGYLSVLDPVTDTRIEGIRQIGRAHV